MPRTPSRTIDRGLAGCIRAGAIERHDGRDERFAGVSDGLMVSQVRFGNLVFPNSFFHQVDLGACPQTPEVFSGIAPVFDDVVSATPWYDSVAR